MPDLLALVLQVKPTPEAVQETEKRGEIPPWWGNAVLKFFKSVVSQYDPKLADEIFANNSTEGEEVIRPFTLSNLSGFFPNQKLDEQGVYRLRITALRRDLADMLLSALQPNGTLCAGSLVELDRLPFTVSGAMSTAAEDEWAGVSEYAALLTERLKAKTADRRVHLSFCSPTFFKVKSISLPLPLPRLVFQSLLRRWNAYSPAAFPEDTLRFAEECLSISRFALSSGIGSRKGKSNLQSGMLGRVTYFALNPDPYWVNVLQVLARYAFFAGVGAATSLGFGQAR